MKRLLILSAVIVSGIVWGYNVSHSDVFKTGNPLLASSGPVELIDVGFSTKVLPDGWVHRTFFRTKPTDYRLIEDDGRRALSCTTEHSGSILAHETFILLADLPILSWSWKVTKPIESTIDEYTEGMIILPGFSCASKTIQPRRKLPKSSGATENMNLVITKLSVTFITLSPMG